MVYAGSTGVKNDDFNSEKQQVGNAGHVAYLHGGCRGLRACLYVGLMPRSAEDLHLNMEASRISRPCTDSELLTSRLTWSRFSPKWSLPDKLIISISNMVLLWKHYSLIHSLSYLMENIINILVRPSLTIYSTAMVCTAENFDG